MRADPCTIAAFLVISASIMLRRVILWSNVIAPIAAVVLIRQGQPWYVAVSYTHLTLPTSDLV